MIYANTLIQGGREEQVYFFVLLQGEGRSSSVETGCERTGVNEQLVYIMASSRRVKITGDNRRTTKNGSPLSAYCGMSKKPISCMLSCSNFIKVTAGLLDLTVFLRVGSNEFVVVQERSMTEYVFMVFAHDPTRAQLEPVVDRRKKEEDWKTVLNHLSRPLELLPGPWD